MKSIVFALAAIALSAAVILAAPGVRYDDDYPYNYYNDHDGHDWKHGRKHHPWVYRYDHPYYPANTYSNHWGY